MPSSSFNLRLLSQLQRRNMKEKVFLEKVHEVERFFGYIRNNFSDYYVFPDYLLVGLRKEILDNCPIELKQKGFTPMEASFLALILLNTSICRNGLRDFAQFWGSSFEEIIVIKNNIENSVTSGILSQYVDSNTIKDDKRHEVIDLFIKK